MVSIGIGAPMATDSSNITNCSTALYPRPPYSSGQPTVSHPSRPIRPTTSRWTGPHPASAPSASRTSGVSSSV